MGALAGNEIEFRQLLALFWRSHQGRRAVELVDNLENGLVQLARRRMRDQDPANPQVHGSASLCRDQRISSLVDAIVNEPVGALAEIDQLLAASFDEAGVEFLPGSIVNQS